jgi:hypothetical protein
MPGPGRPGGRSSCRLAPRAALAILTALTAVVVYPIFAAPEIVEPLSFRTAAMIALLLQNGMMLFFAPILLRKFKKLPGASRIES